MSAGPEGRYALVVATARYSDPKLQLLRAPTADAERLGAALGDPDRGDFEVQVMLDESHGRLTRAIASFFRDRRPQDLLLLHFSCHGVKDDRGDLYLAAADTEVDLLSATGVSATWLSDQIERSRSRRTVVLLDCCFSGSFPFGMRARGRGVNAPEQLQGRGRVIITASNAMEYAFEGDQLEGEGRPSVFTGAVIEGLETGEADLDGDQLISVDDLYDYVYDRVKAATPSQTPLKKSELEGPLYLARSVYRPEVPPEPLDAEPPPAVPARAGRRRRGLFALGAVATVAAVAATAFALLSPDDRPEPPAPRKAARHTTIPAGNLVANPSFESGTADWSTSHAALVIERAADAPEGKNVGHVSRVGVARYYSIDDERASVASAVARSPYTATAWVKATPSSDGRRVCLVLRETRGGTSVAKASRRLTADTHEYRPVRVTYTPKRSGGGIRVYVFRNTTDAPGGEDFLVDAITITKGAATGAATTPRQDC